MTKEYDTLNNALQSSRKENKYLQAKLEVTDEMDDIHHVKDQLIKTLKENVELRNEVKCLKGIKQS